MIHSVPVLCFNEFVLDLATLIIALAPFFNVFTPNLTLRKMFDAAQAGAGAGMLS